MKRLTQLSALEKAELLDELFPEEFPGLLEFAIARAEAIISDPEAFKTGQVNLLHSSWFWFNLVGGIRLKLMNLASNMEDNRKLFSRELFGEINYLFGFHCLHWYVIGQKSANKKFTQAIELLFFY